MERKKLKKEDLKKKDENIEDKSDIKSPEDNNEVQKEQSKDDKIKELEDKIKRMYADMENQRRRYEKEKDDAFETEDFLLLEESLNLIDNLERSKVALQNDDKLKNTEALKKIMEHLDIIYKDMLSILKK